VLWVVVFLVLAVAALAVLVGYAVWLAHKTADVLGELGQLAEQAGQLGDLLAQIQPPEPTGAVPRAKGPATASPDVR
jgi:hypothetical protein